MRVRAMPPSRFTTLRVGAERVGEVHRDLFHLDHDAFDLAAQVAVRDVGGNRDREAGRGGDQRFGDAARQHARITHAAEHHGVEGADDAGDRAEQA